MLTMHLSVLLKTNEQTNLIRNGIFNNTIITNLYSIYNAKDDLILEYLDYND